jgi:hypothetical protein
VFSGKNYQQLTRQNYFILSPKQISKRLQVTTDSANIDLYFTEAAGPKLYFLTKS